jgi:hypothetical protein
LISERHARHAATVLTDEIKNAIGLTPTVASKPSAAGEMLDDVAKRLLK